MEYTQSGSWTALAGLAVIALSKLGIITSQGDVLAIIAGIVSLVGIIKQFIAHKKLAISAGAISPSSN